MAVAKITTRGIADDSVTSAKLASGAVTSADIPDNEITMDKLSQVNLDIAPEILEIQVAAPQAGQDTQWLWTWEQSTLPYARRTITNSPEIQVPLYKQGTYVINNFAAYDLFDDMTQTHSLYLKWIDGAGTDNLVSWAVNDSNNPVSDTHPDINSGNATDVQRINISVPATITPPALTAPNVSYTVTNNGSGAYTFSGAAKGDNPNLGPFYRGGTYTFNISAVGHPLYFTTDNGTNFASGTYFGEYTDGVTGSRTDNGTVTIVVPSDAPDTLYYQCGNHGPMRGAITVKDLAVETNNNGNYIVYFQHTQEGHKTPVELRPIPSLVNQMCLVYDAASGKFVPQDLATYVENTPSFENKIREVAGTAELVVEDGSAVVAKVNVYSDSTYLPLVGNNAGDQAFATDVNTLFIWDGSAWQTTKRTDVSVQTLVDASVSSLVDSAPTTLDTLNELAAALGDDPNFATTITNSIGTKVASADFNSLWDARFASDSTTNLSEGTNLYFTTSRVQSTTINNGSLRGTVNNAKVQYGTSYSGTPTQGSFFFDSLNQKLKIYTGSAFVDAVPAGTGGGGGSETDANTTFRKYTYNITSNTNTISGADINSQTLSYVTDGTENVEVFRNGVKVIEGASYDYVATTGTSVSFTANLDSGDVVEVQVYELLTNDAYYLKTETYTRTEVNTNIATAVSDLVDSSPTTLDTLNELAAALGDDPNFATTVTNSIATKAPLANPDLTGQVDITATSDDPALRISHDGTQGHKSTIRFSNGYTQTFEIGMSDTLGSARNFIISETSTGASTDATNPKYVFKGNGDGQLSITDAADGDVKINLSTNGNTYFTGGNIGIGTSSPDSKLEVSGNDNQQIKVTKSDDGTETVVLSQAGEGWIGTQSNHPLKIGTNYIAKMYLDTDGNFGIGTFSPTDKLHVNGTTRLGSTTYINGKPSSPLGALNVVQTNNISDNGIAIWDNTNARTMRLWVDSTDSYVYSGGDGSAELHINGVNGVTTVAGALHANGSFRLPVSSTDPGSPAEGKIYYNSASKSVKVYDGSGWVPVGGNLLRVSTFDIFSDGSTVALWQMDGNGNDIGGNYNFSGNTGSSNFVSGQFGQAFNGTGTSHMETSSVNLTGAYSVSFWYNSSTTGQANKRLVTVKGTSTSSGWNNYNGSLGFYLGSGVTAGTTSSVTRVAQIPDSAVNDGQWHNLVYTVTTGGTGATWKIYLDGVEYSGAVSGEGRSFNSGSTVAVTTYDGGDGYNTIGKVDQLRIFNRVITPTEIEQLQSVV